MSSRMDRKDQHKKRKSIIKVALLLLITIMLIGLIYKVGQNLITLYNRNQRETAVLRYGVLEDRLEGEGLVLRSEETVQAPANGYFENEVAERDKVRRQDLLGYYINAGNKTAFRAPIAGIFTRQADGLEEVLQNINLQTIGPEVFKYNIQTADPGAEIKTNQVVCKIVNNLIPSQLLLHFPMESRDIYVNKNQTIQLYMDSKLLGDFTVRDYKRDFKDLILIVEAHEFKEDLLYKRLVKVEMVLNSQRGYLVPAKSVVNRDKEKGIYCTKSEEIVFKPIRLLKIKDDIAIVEGLSATDIIIINPSIIKSNQ